MKKFELLQIIREEIENVQREELRETVVDNFLNYVGDVLKKGRVKATIKDVARENPELAKAVADLADSQERIKKIVSKQYDDDQIKKMVDDFKKKLK